MTEIGRFQIDVGIFFEGKESVGNEVRSPIFDSLSTEGTFLNLEKRGET